MNKTNIEWCDVTWNPVTGCKRGCQYCYARRIHERFNKAPFSDVVYHPSRMDDLEWLGKQKNPLKIFVGSMSDIEYWEAGYTAYILSQVQHYYRHTFMFLSKCSASYAGYCWPSNTMQGLTITGTQTPHCQQEMVAAMALYPRPFLSIEPLLGTIYENDFSRIEQVIVGAMTGPKAFTPHQSWIDSVINNVPKDKIFWKNNIKEYLPASAA